MIEEICACSRCGLRGYYPTDIARNLCHLCVQREEFYVPQIEALKEILHAHIANYKNEQWSGCNFAKAFIGNMLFDAVKDLEARMIGTRYNYEELR